MRDSAARTLRVVFFDSSFNLQRVWCLSRCNVRLLKYCGRSIMHIFS